VKTDVRLLLCPSLKAEIKRPRLTLEAAEALRALHDHLSTLLPEEQNDLAFNGDAAPRQRRLH
jgi:hypothetical protein